ncbi:hypothetical protein RGUI_1001 [Rhodovulum sp. P5]|uniref:hypothetical protein n=1 Tax=Rhodovulum sp. P5 TaxID=1564506 RepID=UPI0009C3D1E4|nr:hypothetical protein [Rhodovulum sp. P5]ARE39142.1 hypothetical protein RGUI_1001 [Rhodovulum sp. P5]
MTRNDQILREIWKRARRVAFAILAGFWRRHSAEDIETRISRRPDKEQTAIVIAVLAGLFLTSLLFAHFGLIGMLVFLLLVVLIIH